MMTTDHATARRALALLDLTDLADTASVESTAALCARAVSPPVPVAAVCVWPRFVAAARARLGPGGVRIATVVNFPAGTSPRDTVLDEIDGALAAGADEIDLVLPWRAFLAGDRQSAAAMVEAARARCGETLLKVILETGEYPDLAAVRAGADLAIAAGADFIKTSTGKTAHSATLPAARTMLEAIAESGRPVGLKPSGGLRSLADAAAFLALADEIMGPGWAIPERFRFGASGLHQVLLDVLADAEGGTVRDGY